MKLRLDKMICNLGYSTRSKLKKEIKTGCVSVNNQIITDSSLVINTDDDIVKYNGIELKYTKYIYLMMNKPPGVISATEDYYKMPTVIDLLSDEYKHFQPFPVGRLDKDTEGLLLLTNNGFLAHNLLSPRKHVSKIYYAEIQGILTDNDVFHFKNGIKLEDGYITMPASLDIISTNNSNNQSFCKVTIKEGKFHQIKRMFNCLNKRVIYLKRISMGEIVLDEKLSLGEYRELNSFELELLKPYMS